MKLTLLEWELLARAAEICADEGHFTQHTLKRIRKLVKRIDRHIQELEEQA